MLCGITLAAVTLTLPSWGNGAPALQIDVPAGYRLKHTEGPDFDVYQITRKHGGARIGLYVGHHPDTSQCAQPAADLADLQWALTEKREGQRTLYGADVLLQGLFAGSRGAGVRQLLVHAFVRGTDPAEVELLKKATATLRASPVPPKQRGEFRAFALPSFQHPPCR